MPHGDAVTARGDRPPEVPHRYPALLTCGYSVDESGLGQWRPASSVSAMGVALVRRTCP